MILEGIRPTPPKTNIDINVEVKGQERYPSVTPLPDMIDVSDADLGTEAEYMNVLNRAITGETAELQSKEAEKAKSRETSGSATPHGNGTHDDSSSQKGEMRIQDMHAAPRTAMSDEVASVVLALQRTKLDNMADWYADQLKQKNWVLNF
jgi:hypothetical protein